MTTTLSSQSPQMPTFVSWLWHSGLSREPFKVEDVVRLRNALSLYYPKPHRFLCVTDMNPSSFPSNLETMKLWTEGAEYGGCYRRLKMFNHPEFTGRSISMDIDCVIVDDISNIVERQEDVILWKSNTAKSLYNGSIMSVNGNKEKEVYDTLTPETFARHRKTTALRYNGTDQSWLSQHYVDRCPTYTYEDGIVDYKRHCRHFLPGYAKLVFFPGRPKATHSQVQAKHEWVRHYYDITQP